MEPLGIILVSGSTSKSRKVQPKRGFYTQTLMGKVSKQWDGVKKALGTLGQNGDKLRGLLSSENLGPICSDLPIF